MTESIDGRFFPVENPAHRGTVIAEVPRASAADVDRAVVSARRAFDVWRSVVPSDRGRLLMRIADDIEGQVETLARLLASETGNAVRPQARPEISAAASVIRYFGSVAGELKGEVVPLGDDTLSYSRREPIGVTAGIIPWNSPALLGALKIAMSIAAGNSLVLKASADAPLTVMEIAKICDKFLPVGVLNVLTGFGEECGAPLARHPGVGKLSFTGSTEVGKAIMHAAADRIVPVSLELGGKSPAIVFPDSDDDQTVDGVIAGMRFTRQGQSCTAGSRLFLHDSIYESFLGKLAARLNDLIVGDPLEETTDMGAIINLHQFNRVRGFIVDGMRQDDSKLVTGATPPAKVAKGAGYYVRPTVFSNVHNGWRIAREEIFGPVLVVIRWQDEAAAIRMANDSHYGLAAYVWCRDLKRALRTAHQLDAGWVQVNQGRGQVPGQSYGGFKESGIGREFSLEGMLESFTQRKSITINLRD